MYYPQGINIHVFDKLTKQKPPGLNILIKQPITKLLYVGAIIPCRDTNLIVSINSYLGPQQ